MVICCGLFFFFHPSVPCSNLVSCRTLSPAAWVRSKVAVVTGWGCPRTDSVSRGFGKTAPPLPLTCKCLTDVCQEKSETWENSKAHFILHLRVPPGDIPSPDHFSGFWLNQSRGSLSGFAAVTPKHIHIKIWESEWKILYNYQEPFLCIS